MQRIEIKNFRQIIYANIQVNGLTILIGEQASGKSTIAKLVYFFKSLRKDLVEMARLKPEEINGKRITDRIRNKFYLYFGSTERLKPDYSIVFYYSPDHKIILTGSRPLSVIFDSQLWFNEIENTIRRSTKLVNFYRGKEDIDSADKEERMLDLALSEIIIDDREVLYIPAGRNITVSYTDEMLSLFRELVRVKTEVEIGPDELPKRKDGEEIDTLLLRDFILHSSKVREAYKGIGMEGMLRYVKKDIRDILELLRRN